MSGSPAPLQLDLQGPTPGFELHVALSAADRPVALVGPNGSGKSTVLMMALGVRKPARGLVRVGARTLFDSTAGVDLPTELRGIGYVPQDYGLFPHLDVRRNVCFGAAAHGIGREERRLRMTHALERLEIGHLAGRRVRELSGGERQRVALARALVAQPSALLLDEPLAALDAGARRSVRSFLAVQLRALGLPCVVVTHELADAEALDADVVVLERGQVVQTGRIHELRASPATAFVEELVRR